METIGYPLEKKKNLGFYSLYIKIDSIWVIDLSVKAKAIELLGKTGEYFCNLELHRERFLGEVTETMGHKNKT